MDLFWRENLVVPTEQEYIEMVNNSELLSPSRRRSRSPLGLEMTAEIGLRSSQKLEDSSG